ncbi:TPA: MFS transporter [Klebsiella oxytoca]
MRNISLIGGMTLLAVASLTIMVGCVIVPGLPAISSHLHVEQFSGWLVTLPALGVVLFGPLTTKIIKQIGLYRTLCSGLFFYGLLGSAGAFLQGHVLLLADRFLLGGVTALVMTSGTGLISEFYQGSQRLKMIAMQGMSIELGGVIFLFSGGLLATMHWASPFSLYLFAWILLGMVLGFVPKKVGVFAVQNSDVINSENTSMAVKITWISALVSMIIFFTAIILLPIHLKKMAITSSQTGTFLSFISLVAVGAAWVMPKMVRKISEVHTLITAFLFYAIGHVIFSLTTSIYVMILGAIAMGSGFGLSVPLVNHLVLILSPANMRSRNLARLSMAIFSGQFLSSFMGYIPGSMAAAFSVTALLSLLISIYLYLNRKSFKDGRMEHTGCL